MGWGSKVSEIIQAQVGSQKYYQVKYNNRTGQTRTEGIITNTQRDWLHVIPMTRDGEVILAKDYFPGADTRLFSGFRAPATANDIDYKAQAMACLEESLGMPADAVVSLGYAMPNPQLTNERVFIFLAFTSASEVNVKKVTASVLESEVKAVLSDILYLSSPMDIPPGLTFDMDGVTALGIARLRHLLAGFPLSPINSGAMMLGYIAGRRAQEEGELLDRFPDDLSVSDPFGQSSRDQDDFDRGKRIYEKIERAMLEVSPWS